MDARAARFREHRQVVEEITAAVGSGLRAGRRNTSSTRFEQRF